jgi:ketosteroid isomerase-like protein
MAGGAELVRGAYEAFGRGDVPAVLEVLADDVSWNAPDVIPQGGSFHGRDGAGQFFQGLGGAWEELRLDVEDVIEGGDNVVGFGRATGRLRGGGDSGYGFVHIFTVSGGRVIRFREYVDPDPGLPRAGG